MRELFDLLSKASSQKRERYKQAVEEAQKELQQLKEDKETLESRVEELMLGGLENPVTDDDNDDDDDGSARGGLIELAVAEILEAVEATDEEGPLTNPLEGKAMFDLHLADLWDELRQGTSYSDMSRGYSDISREAVVYIAATAIRYLVDLEPGEADDE